jgi:hypothetical protein
MRSCQDFKDELGFPGCCISCHDDEEEGYTPLLDETIETPTGLEVVCVCCRVANFLEHRDDSKGEIA